ncbi:DUF5081 family protein [Neobacillus soli]|uniref:DUF5081 family protein n=1 Tax=Neobacillus soli TaxID=220688 RepID=UPI0008267863|nr:DUF5081 family protein [Neobacillus soli]
MNLEFFHLKEEQREQMNANYYQQWLIFTKDEKLIMVNPVDKKYYHASQILVLESTVLMKWISLTRRKSLMPKAQKSEGGSSSLITINPDEITTIYQYLQKIMTELETNTAPNIGNSFLIIFE